ncbi:DUF5615 family PIN-like protein [Rubrivirga sp.]|uniref:DUF5615 family PIN-like protein n=1 Tax=Rubrivirga sp. TaxID=1885344 RepID=UPI003B529BB1
MRFVADESVDGPIVRALRDAGHSVEYVAERSAGLSDSDVLARAQTLAALLLTADSDFGELVFRQGRAHSGVLLLRLSGLGEEGKVRVVRSAVRDHESDLAGAFSVLTPTALRIRAA